MLKKSFRPQIFGKVVMSVNIY